MNETDLRGLIPNLNAVRAVAVSPILKVTASETTKVPLDIYVPKPGHTIFGSVKLGLRCKLAGKKHSHHNVLSVTGWHK